ncbi:hypothetical protein AB4Z48_16515 [Cupriavidus sp. 2TAF22]|uniref:hypothetical protein n=1 Tax=unclassified Cupriavidus TaxID=2640874 RepID=UPI003F91D8A4
MKEQKRMVDGIEVTFRRKRRKYDARHLIVVFSGFGLGEFTYDFEHALQDCPADVLWIKDQFDGHCAYYVCKDMDFSIEAAVFALIDAVLDELGLTKNQCTLAGFSKGGSAALYFGMKHGFDNIVATVPQFRIGSYIARNWPVVAAHMMGEADEEKVRVLDRLLPEALAGAACDNKNVYLLTSPSDPQFAAEIVPNLGGFVRCSNFNLLVSRSRLVREHNQVTQHNVPLLLGIFYSLAAGAVPRFGYTEMIGDDAGPPTYPEVTPIAALRRVRIEGGRLFPEGVAVLRGLSCGEYQDISSFLILHGGPGDIEIPLAKANRPGLTRELYDGGFVNYDKGWFCTYQHKGVDLAEVPAGEYRVSLRIHCQGVTRTSAMMSAAQVDVQGPAGTHLLRLFTSGGLVHLVKTPLAGTP